MDDCVCAGASARLTVKIIFRILLPSHKSNGAMFTAADGHLRQHEIYSTSTLAVPRTTHDRWLAYCSLPPKKKEEEEEGGWMV